MFGRKFTINLSLKVIRRCSLSKMKLGNVLFVKVTEFPDTLCRLPGTYYHQPGCKRIKSSCMAHFNFFNAEFASDHYPDFVHQVKRCPVKRFIKKQKLSFFKEC